MYVTTTATSYISGVDQLSLFISLIAGEGSGLGYTAVLGANDEKFTLQYLYSSIYLAYCMPMQTSLVYNIYNTFNVPKLTLTRYCVM